MGVIIARRKSPSFWHLASHMKISFYNVDQKRPFMSSDRAADRARVAAEATAATTARKGTNSVLLLLSRVSLASSNAHPLSSKTAVMKKRLQELSAAQLEREDAARRFEKKPTGRSLISRGFELASRRGPMLLWQRNR